MNKNKKIKYQYRIAPSGRSVYAEIFHMSSNGEFEIYDMSRYFRHPEKWFFNYPKDGPVQGQYEHALIWVTEQMDLINKYC